MASSCCTVLGKVIFILLNVLYLLVGLGMVAVGVLILVAKLPTEVVTGTSDVVLPILVIVCGIIIFVLSIVGMAGACADVWQLVLIYSIAMIILILFQIIGVVVMIVYRQHDLQSRIVKRMKQYIKDYDPDDASSRVLVDAVQRALHCCGINSVLDWSLYNSDYRSIVPDSCLCTAGEDHCFFLTVDGVSVWNRGCNETIYNYLHKITIFTGVGMALSQVLFIAVGLCLCACILADKNRGTRYRRLTTVNEGTGMDGVNVSISNTSSNTLSQTPYGVPYTDALPTHVPLQKNSNEYIP